MLSYLIMYVRGAASGEPARPSNACRVDGGSAEYSAANSDSAEIQRTSSDTPIPPPSKSLAPPLLARRASAGEGAMLLVMLCTLSSLTGCACFRSDQVDANVVTARQISLKGIDAIQKGQWDDAETLFAEALRKNPVDERAHRQYAEIMWKRGQFETATRHMEKSVRLSGGDPNLLVQLGEMYLGQNNPEAAWECAQEAIDTNAQLPEAWALRGDIHRRRGEWNEALQTYHRALSYNAHFPRVQLALANVYRELGRPQRALATLDALASQYGPEDTPQEVLYQQGMTYKSLQRFEDAVTVFTLASQRAEPTADLLFQLGEAQYLAGNTANARLALQAALGRSPDHQASHQLQQKLDHESQHMTAAIKR